MSSEPHHIPSHLTTPLSLNDIPPWVAQTMENEDSWDFDIFNLEAATIKRYGGGRWEVGGGEVGHVFSMLQLTA